MANARLRARLERLLGGDIRLDDLTNIFLDIRTGCASESVREIGDFIAHGGERYKGIVTETALDWAITSDFQNWIVLNNFQKPADLARRPSNYIRVLEASLRRHDSDDIIRQMTGLDRSTARQTLKSLEKRFVRNSDGTLRLQGSHSAAEFKLMGFLGNTITGRIPFTADDLLADLKTRLAELGALEEEEMSRFDALKPVISLFALSKMHNVELTGAGLTKKLVTKVRAPTPAGGMTVIAEGAPIVLFTTSISSKDYCTPELLAEAQPWACEIEMTPELKLHRLG